MDQLILWTEWAKAFSSLRQAFSRQRTYLWAFAACAGMASREDRLGVTSIVRVLGFGDAGYHALLRMFHSSGINLDKLLELWILLCLKIFTPACVDGYMVIVGDGIKVSKEGRKMPAVKSLYQDSQSNSKAEFIMGHYLEAFSLLVVSPLGSLFCIPLVAHIHDGITRSNRCTKTIIDRFCGLLEAITEKAGVPAIVVADAYYAAKKTINLMASTTNCLVTRVQHNAVAFFPAPVPPKRGRGRPRKYGEKVHLKSLFQQFGTLATVTDDCRYYCVDLLWSTAKTLVRFVLVEHDGRHYILMTTNLQLAPMTVIKLYRSRTLIESSFKQSLQVIGTYCYHFWMKSMTPIRRRSKGQFLHRQSKTYRDKVDQKLKAFHTHVQLGCIAQGLALHLAINFRDHVWRSFGGWLRTLRKTQEPSELVVSMALRSALPNFLGASPRGSEEAKFLRENIDVARQGPLSNVG
jgi:hypothetical protein